MSLSSMWWFHEAGASLPSIIEIDRETIEGTRRNKSQHIRTGRETSTAEPLARCRAAANAELAHVERIVPVAFAVSDAVIAVYVARG
jgi:hypothetical protein